MFRLLPLFLAATSLLAAPRHADGLWTIENDTLRITVHDDTATWDVTDKRSGQLWPQATEPAVSRLVLPMPKLSSAPDLDGALSDWSGNGLYLDSQTVAVKGQATEAQDCGANVWLGWDASGCWLAAEVTDDSLVGPTAGAELWQVDGLELWLGEEHWGFCPGAPEATIACFSNPARATGCRAASQITAKGWALEAFVPWSQVADVKGQPQVGQRVLLAVGLNDTDGKPPRQTQLFYPRGYQHKVFSTHCEAELAAAAGAPRTETQAPRQVAVRRITPLAAPAEGVQIELDYTQPDGGTVPLKATLRLRDGADVEYELSAPADLPFSKIELPAPFILDAPKGELVSPQAAGLLFGVDELEWHGRSLGGNYSMPWFGATDLATGAGYLGILVTPDDADFHGAKVHGAQRDVLSVQPWFMPRKGRFGYPRRMLYHFADQGNYVALAKRYRAYARQAGLLKTLAEKRRERPSIDRLVGAVNIYGSYYDDIQELHRLGVERAMVNGFNRTQIEEMNSWGWLTTRYDIYTDLYEPGTPPSKWERCEGFSWPEDVIKTADGSNQVGWCPILNPTTGKKDPSYVACWTCGLRTLKQKMPKRLAERPLNAYFMDCVTSTRLYECYDPNHPLTRTTDKEARIAQFQYLSGDLGLVVGSESGRDWAVPAADYFEGIVSTAAFFANPPEIHQIPFVSCEPTPRYEEYGTNEVRRVPLFQLVYGDCCETTWRWGDNSHRMPKLWAQKDLLQMLHATMPTWVLWEPHQDLFWANTDRFMECYRNLCGWRRAVGYSEMTNHERLTDDAKVQRSTFANGAAVTVNFAHEPRTVDGVTLPPRSYLLTGDPKILAGLPVGQPVQVSDPWEPKTIEHTGNTGFEESKHFWRGAGGMTLTVQDEVVHAGRQAAKLTGTQANGFSFASAVRVPLEAGRRYRIRGWLRVDALDPPTHAPCFKCQVDHDRQYLTNFFTKQYDLTKLGTWQLLETTFTAPKDGNTGNLALEKRTTKPVAATIYVDDVELAQVN